MNHDDYSKYTYSTSRSSHNAKNIGSVEKTNTPKSFIDQLNSTKQSLEKNFGILGSDGYSSVADTDSNLSSTFSRMTLFNTPSPQLQSFTNDYTSKHHSQTSFSNPETLHNTEVSASSYFPRTDYLTKRTTNVESSPEKSRKMPWDDDQSRKTIVSPFERYKLDTEKQRVENEKLLNELQETRNSKIKHIAQYQTEKKEWTDKNRALEDKLHLAVITQSEKEEALRKQKSLYEIQRGQYEDRIERYFICVI
jgi:hypothetical protein